MTESGKGLENVVLADSSITLVAGETGGLVYRGFDIAQLVPGTSYESVVHLLLFGDPPPESPPSKLTEELARRRAIPPEIESVVDAIPASATPLEALRTLLSVSGDHRFEYPPTVFQGFDLIAQAPTLLARYVRRQRGLPPIAPSVSPGHVREYLRMLTGDEPDPSKVRALEDYFVLLADHGMNASTFALRVVL